MVYGYFAPISSPVDSFKSPFFNLRFLIRTSRGPSPFSQHFGFIIVDDPIPALYLKMIHAKLGFFPNQNMNKYPSRLFNETTQSKILVKRVNDSC